MFACGSMIATITPKQGYKIIINNAVRVLRMVKICTQELNEHNLPLNITNMTSFRYNLMQFSA